MGDDSTAPLQELKDAVRRFRGARDRDPFHGAKELRGCYVCFMGEDTKRFVRSRIDSHGQLAPSST